MSPLILNYCTLYLGRNIGSHWKSSQTPSKSKEFPLVQLCYCISVYDYGSEGGAWGGGGGDCTSPLVIARPPRLTSPSDTETDWHVILSYEKTTSQHTEELRNAIQYCVLCTRNITTALASNTTPAPADNPTHVQAVKMQLSELT